MEISILKNVFLLMLGKFEKAISNTKITLNIISNKTTIDKFQYLYHNFPHLPLSINIKNTFFELKSLPLLPAYITQFIVSCLFEEGLLFQRHSQKKIIEWENGIMCFSIKKVSY